VKAARKEYKDGLREKLFGFHMWGYDVASPPVLFDAVIDGKTVPAVGEASKLVPTIADR